VLKREIKALAQIFFKIRAYPTIVSYNASAVKTHNGTSNEDKNIFFFYILKIALVYYNAASRELQRQRCKKLQRHE
jgi:hypothetical protein